MKKILFYLSIILFSTALYSQQKHSDIKVDCSFCHSCENPTKNEPCIKDCPRHTMITVHHSPSEGPLEIKIDILKKEKDLYSPVIFSHRAHSEMSQMGGGCSMCHHYNPPGRVVACKECHDVNRQRADLRKPDLNGAYHRQCIDCHKLWSDDKGCTYCHAKNSDSGKNKITKTVPKKDRIHPEVIAPNKVVYNAKSGKNKFVTFYHNDHTNLFSLECKDCHKDESCVKCHAKEKIIKKQNKTLNQKHQLCSSCHDTAKNCNNCHMEKVTEGFNHKIKTGFDISKFHAALKCRDCHKKPKSFTGLKGTCSNCHQEFKAGTFDHRKAKLVLDEIHAEIDCSDCHTNANYQKPTCENCHDDKSFPANLPGKKIK
ncbi:MAG: hypothetical protein CVV23_00365 [Ignavibacteriae bacterium HGW-Ignavibacteriae-2]|jgi:hypothetical protein|nr:MAG: hypothetical protein CVV23_00365 [Ignavibacteriae bacterium HGW-Ignavibacteriae-2]